MHCIKSAITLTLKTRQYDEKVERQKVLKSSLSSGLKLVRVSTICFYKLSSWAAVSKYDCKICLLSQFCS